MSAECIEDLVHEDKKLKWHSEVKSKWFATNSPRSQKTPGYLKEEFSSSTGKYIGLRLSLQLS